MKLTFRAKLCARHIRHLLATGSKGHSNYIDGNETFEAVTDILADLRHYCDAKELNFGECDRVAEQHYIAEKGGE